MLWACFVCVYASLAMLNASQKSENENALDAETKTSTRFIQPPFPYAFHRRADLYPVFHVAPLTDIVIDYASFEYDRLAFPLDRVSALTMPYLLDQIRHNRDTWEKSILACLTLLRVQIDFLDLFTYIRFSDPILHWGLFASKRIPANILLGVYLGVVTADTVDADYAWIYDPYVMYTTPDRHQENARVIVDGRFSGNQLRFVNHAPKEACNVAYETVYVQDRFYIVYYTLRDIDPHEQLFVNYGDNYWTTRPLKQPLSNPKK